jgi:ATP-dependent Lon protease
MGILTKEPKEAKLKLLMAEKPAQVHKNARQQKAADISTDQEEKALIAEIKTLHDKLKNSALPAGLKEEIASSLDRLNRAMKHSFYQAEFEQTSRYVDWLISLPWNKRSTDNLDLKRAKETLDKNHHGLEQIKERILEYLAVLKLQAQKEGVSVVRLSRSPVLCFVGLPGSGKTSLAASIAESLGRSFVRIPMGGMVSPLVLRGQTKTLPEAEPGMIIKGLRRVQVKNPVILLDEIDSTAEGVQSEVMGVLLELLDPEQNNAFMDYYIDHPFDLSEALFVCSANKIGNITGAVMDRLEIIIIPRYTDEEKIRIARDYLLPRELKNVGLEEKTIKFSEDVWPLVIKPFGYDIDIRALQRTINGILRKVAKKYVEGKVKQVTITSGNLPQFLPEFV